MLPEFLYAMFSLHGMPESFVRIRPGPFIQLHLLDMSCESCQTFFNSRGIYAFAEDSSVACSPSLDIISWPSFASGKKGEQCLHIYKPRPN